MRRKSTPENSVNSLWIILKKRQQSVSGLKLIMLFIFSVVIVKRGEEGDPELEEKIIHWHLHFYMPGRHTLFQITIFPSFSRDTEN